MGGPLLETLASVLVSSGVPEPLPVLSTVPELPCTDPAVLDFAEFPMPRGKAVSEMVWTITAHGKKPHRYTCTVTS